ncbi:PREDICTED: lipopolysaccharide-induced tumor necrosis factor-alpha factor homolog [Rhagoletis zephyria]|uniref:lipopolysaccharide-induced tumor necrosis factor-alpha factor homolog n=1 Tax=Rhagoletis zephyria TaxID=28612 RepID=UPI0008115B4D|nr:PREDICTED: lipopolysaccharide-induced tumor necrosis factor-alpha factor homolog [Rhagoletis zephyria]
MDQKRAMLYPDIDPAHNAATHGHRISASAAMGLPAEAPPSYDFAIASTSTPTPTPTVSNTKGGAGSGALGWTPSAPAVTTPEPQAPSSQPLPHDGQTRPVIVVQPLPQQQTQSPTTQVGNIPTRMKLGPNPCAVICPVCGANKTTRMVFTPNTRTHICAGILCLAGFCCCACLVPYCMNSCRTGNHYCSQCNTFLGVYNPRKV